MSEKEAAKKKVGEREHLINATTVDGRLLVGRADGEDLRQGGGRSSEGGMLLPTADIIKRLPLGGAVMGTFKYCPVCSV